MPKNPYTLYIYNFDGQQVISAIHWRDGAKFRAEHPDAKVFASPKK